MIENFIESSKYAQNLFKIQNEIIQNVKDESLAENVPIITDEVHENFSKHIGKLVCRHGAKPCNKETELLGTLKASITIT